MPTLLAEISKTEPGRYLSADELRRLESEEPYLAPRIRAARNAQAAEPEILRAVLEPLYKRYDFDTGRTYGREKGYRDVGIVYQYCVFAMLKDDMRFLENKLLFWLRTILQSLNFPGGNDCIRDTYVMLRKETHRRLPKEDAALLDPFLKACEEVLPAP